MATFVFPAAVAGDMCQQGGGRGCLLCPTFPHLADLFLTPTATSGATCPLLSFLIQAALRLAAIPFLSPPSAVSPCPVEKVTATQNHTECVTDLGVGW